MNIDEVKSYIRNFSHHVHNRCLKISSLDLLKDEKMILKVKEYDIKAFIFPHMPRDSLQLCYVVVWMTSLIKKKHHKIGDYLN